MSINTLKIKTPIACVQGRFADHLVTYSTQVAPGDIINLLGHDPRGKNWGRLPIELREIYQYLQRKTSKDRRESIAGYIDERFGTDPLTIGAFPAISIALSNPAEFVPYDSEGKRIPQAVGELMVDLSVNTKRILIDGLGRVTGALDLIDEGRLEAVANFLFPVTIFAPLPDSKHELSWRQLGQLFHDFNYRVHPVSRQHAIALDASDLYIVLANKLGDAWFIKEHGGVAVRAASLGKKSTELVVQSVLVRAVRGACEGRQFQESNLAHLENGNLNRDTMLTVKSSLEDFFGGLAGRMGDRWAEHNSIHLAAPGWQALGVVHHDLVYRLNMGEADRNRVLDRIAAIDWSRFNADWIQAGLGVAEIDKATGEPIKDGKGRTKIALTGAGRSNVQRVLDYVRAKAGYADRIKGDEPQTSLFDASTESQAA